MIELLATRYNYVAAIAIMAIGLYMIVADRNLIKKIIGMNLFQTGIFLVFVTAAVVEGGAPPVVGGAEGPFVSPLPHVLILTAIVVGVSLTAVALTLVVRIYGEYGTLREDLIGGLNADD